MYFKRIAISIIVVLFLVGCVSTLYIPTEIDAAKYNISLDTLKTGRELYLNNCGSCHNLYLPTQYVKQDWVQIMEKMQKPAKIDNSQKELINKYLETSCKK
jgi:mono/diheme cytochrome c family protein